MHEFHPGQELEFLKLMHVRTNKLAGSYPDVWIKPFEKATVEFEDDRGSTEPNDEMVRLKITFGEHTGSVVYLTVSECRELKDLNR